MKRTLEFLLIGLLAGGLLTGCPKKEEETKAEEPTPTETAKQEEPPVEEPAEEPKAEVNEENYLKAAFEVTCVRTKIEDVEKQKEIVAEVYPRYGFTEESFNEAQEAMKDKDTIKTALDAKMAECTPELAASFAKAGEADADAGTAEAPKEDPKKEDPKKPAKAWKAGAYTDNGVKGGGFEAGEIRLNVTDEGKVMGSFKGKREGKGFMIPIKGEIGKDGSLNASGNKGPNNARVNGRYKDGQVMGKIKGAVNKKGFDVTFNAK